MIAVCPNGFDGKGASGFAFGSGAFTVCLSPYFIATSISVADLAEFVNQL